MIKRSKKRKKNDIDIRLKEVNAIIDILKDSSTASEVKHKLL